MKKINWLASSFVLLTVALGAANDWVHLDNESPDLLKEVQDAIYIPKELAEYNYKLAKDAHDIFEEHGIRYWITFGTLLGALRHKGIVPWDDDVDFGIFEEDRDALLALAPVFETMGYQLVLDREELVGYKVEARECITLPNGKVVRPFIDLFAFVPEGDRYMLKFQGGRERFPNAWYLKDQVETVKKYPFGPLKLWGPTSYCDESDPFNRGIERNALTRWYGPDWKTYARFYFAHHGATGKKYDWTLTERDLQAAPAK